MGWVQLPSQWPMVSRGGGSGEKCGQIGHVGAKEEPKAVVYAREVCGEEAV